MRTLLHENEMVFYVTAVLPREVFLPIHQEIIEWLETCAEQEQRPDELNAATELSEEANAELARILLTDSLTPRGAELSVFKDSIRTLQKVVLNKRYYELLAQAEEYSLNDEAAYVKTVEESLKIKKKIDNLSLGNGN